MQIQWARLAFKIRELRWISCLSRGASIEVRLEAIAATNFHPRPGDQVMWVLPDEKLCGPLEVRGFAQGWYRCEAPIPPPPTADGNADTNLNIYQCTSEESAIEFAARVMRGCQQIWAVPDGADAPATPKPFANGWKQGAVCMRSPNEGASTTAATLCAMLREDASRFLGMGQALPHDIGRDGVPWRCRFHRPDLKDAPYNLDIGARWRTSESPFGGEVGGDASWISAERTNLPLNDLSNMLTELLNPGACFVEIQGNSPFPVPRLPVTVHLADRGARPFFCSTIVVQISKEVDPENDLWHVRAMLSLNEGARVTEPPCPQSRYLLAKCVEAPAKEGGRLYTVRPPAALPEEFELRQAAAWSMNPPDAVLTAARVVPGFVREEETAFYSKIQPGDLVWIHMTQGGLPVICGAVHQRTDRWEVGTHQADVAIHASVVEIGSGKDGPTGTWDAEKVKLASPGKVSLKSPSVEIEGQLQVNGPTTFNDDVNLA